MINPQWLELPMSRKNFHGPKDVRAIEVRLYLFAHLFIHLFSKVDKNTTQLFHSCLKTKNLTYYQIESASTENALGKNNKGILSSIY